MIDKILSRAKEDRTNNLNWIELLINNTNTEKYLHSKLSYLYGYFCELCDVKYSPSPQFETFKSIIEKLVDFVIDFCFQNKIDDKFNLNTKKEIKENITSNENNLFITKLNKIMELELKKREKDEFLLLKDNTIKIINEIEPIKNELNKIYDALIIAIKNDIKLEKERMKSENEAKRKNISTDSLTTLTEYSNKYSEKFRYLKSVENKDKLNLAKFYNDVVDILNYKKKLSNFKDIYSPSEKFQYILNLEENCKKLIMKDKNKTQINISKEQLELGYHYFPIKFKGKNDNEMKEKDLYYNTLVEKIDEKAKNKYYKKNNNEATVSEDNIVKLSISDKEVDINKKGSNENLLYEVKEIVTSIVERIMKINHNIDDEVLDYGKPRLKKQLDAFK